MRDKWLKKIGRPRGFAHCSCGLTSLSGLADSWSPALGGLSTALSRRWNPVPYSTLAQQRYGHVRARPREHATAALRARLLSLLWDDQDYICVLRMYL